MDQTPAEISTPCRGATALVGVNQQERGTTQTGCANFLKEAWNRQGIVMPCQQADRCACRGADFARRMWWGQYLCKVSCGHQLWLEHIAPQ